MEFQVGETVVHSAYGPCEIIQLDEKVLADKKVEYYVIRKGDMTIWVPRSVPGSSRLRRLTPGKEYKKLFAILRSPGEPLSNDRFERKTQLMEQLKDGKLESVCRVVRDLSSYGKTRKLNDNDLSILDRSRKFLLNEWRLSLSIPMSQADDELQKMLGESSHKG